MKEKMKEEIAYCGLDCNKCEARTATINNDDALREKTAKLWSEKNGVEITKEMINCTGCKADGVKTPFCESMCEIRKCAALKEIETCGECEECAKCDKIKGITDNNKEAAENIKKAAQEKEDKDSKSMMWLPLGLCFGAAIGTAIGSAMGNIALGIAIGPCLGLCIGAALSLISQASNDKDKKD